MHDCIFSAHCTELVCDRSCPRYVETSYLLERNNIPPTSAVFSDLSVDVGAISAFMDKVAGETATFIVSNDGRFGLLDVSRAADFFTYVGICKYYQGSRLHCTVYNLRYSKYIDELKKSWSLRVEPDSLEYMRIWAETAKVLIISNLDYVNFSDFECQTLLNLLQSRDSAGLTSIIICRPVSGIKGKSVFLSTLTDKILQASKKVVL